MPSKESTAANRPGDPLPEARCTAATHVGRAVHLLGVQAILHARQAVADKACRRSGVDGLLISDRLEYFNFFFNISPAAPSGTSVWPAAAAGS